MQVYIITVDNKPGVLDRIAGLVRRSGWNISTITAAETEQSEITSITISSRRVEKIPFPKDGLKRLDCVHSVVECSPEDHSLYEVLTLSASRDALSSVLPLAVKTEQNGDSVIAHFIGSYDQIDSISAKIANIDGIRRLRTGVIAMQHQT